MQATDWLALGSVFVWRWGRFHRMLIRAVSGPFAPVRDPPYNPKPPQLDERWRYQAAGGGRGAGA